MDPSFNFIEPLQRSDSISQRFHWICKVLESMTSAAMPWEGALMQERCGRGERVRETWGQTRSEQTPEHQNSQRHHRCRKTNGSWPTPIKPAGTLKVPPLLLLVKNGADGELTEANPGKDGGTEIFTWDLDEALNAFPILLLPNSSRCLDRCKSASLAPKAFSSW